jgi:hypothetical protein
LVSQGYKRNLSFPHSLPFFTVFLCYQILSIPLSLSLIIVILLYWFWFLKSLEQLGCYNLFPLNNTEIALEKCSGNKLAGMVAAYL